MIGRFLSTIHVNFTTNFLLQNHLKYVPSKRAYNKMVMADHKRNGMKKYLIVSSF